MSIDFLYQHLGHRMVGEFVTVQTNGEKQFCVCCQRFNSEWVDPERYVLGESYGEAETHCLGCHALYHGSERFLGQEGFRGANPTFHKLGMLKGCGALVWDEQQILYAPKKYYPKFKACKELIFSEVLDLGGKEIILDALARAPNGKPFLFISNFGVKKADLVQNLKTSTSKQSIYVCSEGSQIVVPSMYLELQTLVQSMGKGAKEWITLFRKSCSNYLSVDEAAQLNQITQTVPGMIDALKRLPADPHNRIQIIKLMGDQ